MIYGKEKVQFTAGILKLHENAKELFSSENWKGNIQEQILKYSSAIAPRN